MPLSGGRERASRALRLSRRSMIGSGALLAVAACASETGPIDASAAKVGHSGAPASADIPANFRADGNKTYSPQVVYGPRSAKKYTELAISLHYGASRDYLKGPFHQRLAEASVGQRMLIVTHYIRTPNEVPLGELLLRRGPKYPEAMMAVMGLTAAMGPAISEREAEEFLNDASYPAVSSINPANPRFALGAARMVYDEAGPKETPFIREGGNG